MFFSGPLPARNNLIETILIFWRIKFFPLPDLFELQTKRHEGIGEVAPLGIGAVVGLGLGELVTQAGVFADFPCRGARPLDLANVSQKGGGRRVKCKKEGKMQF